MSRLLVLATLLGWLGLQSAWAGAALHLTRAEVSSQDALGYTAPPQEAKALKLAAPWTEVELPHVLPRPLLRGREPGDPALAPTIVTWYRLRVPPQPEGAPLSHIYIPRWKTDGQLAVYADGKLLYVSQGDIYWNGWNIPLRIAVDARTNAHTPSEILLRIQRPRDSGGGISSVWLEPDDSLNWRYRLRYLLQVQLPYTSSAAFLAVGLFSLFVWLRLRQERSYLLFFLIAMAAFLRTLHYHIGEEKLPIPEQWFSWLTINSLFWTVVATHFFLNYLHRRPSHWLNLLVGLTTLAVGLMTLPAFSSLINAYTQAPLVYIALILLGSMVAGTGLYQSWRVRSRDGLLLGSWAVIGMLLGCYDWLLQNNYISIESLYLGPYSNIGAFLIFMHIIFRRYLAANDSVRELNAQLTSRLKAREDELELSYQRLRQIEHRQTLSDERQRMMQDMHDGMGSSLLTALLAAEKGKLDATMLADVLKTCIDDLKLTIDSLEPVQADLLLLLATLRFRLAPRLENAGIRLQWEVRDIPALQWLDPRNGLHILRILQEAFANIIKHTRATQIQVATAHTDESVMVTVADNGQGFAADQPSPHSGKGLNNQLRRAAAIGAQLVWESSEAGTRLTLVLPIRDQKSTVADSK